MIILLIFPLTSFSQNVHISGAERALKHRESPDQKYLAPKHIIQRNSPGYKSTGTGFFTSQVNVDGYGNNIFADAANEPSIAVDPTNPNKMVIGWRQFDNVQSNYRQAGYGYTTDGGQSWTFPGVIEPFVFVQILCWITTQKATFIITACQAALVHSCVKYLKVQMEVPPGI